MRRILLAVALAAASGSALGAASALAHVLSVERASAKARSYAHRACDADRRCDRYGVKSCRRRKAHVVICDVFNDRDTSAQGRYRCSRLVRVAYTSADSRRPAITGFGDWRC